MTDSEKQYKCICSFISPMMGNYIPSRNGRLYAQIPKNIEYGLKKELESGRIKDLLKSSFIYGGYYKPYHEYLNRTDFMFQDLSNAVIKIDDIIINDNKLFVNVAPAPLHEKDTVVINALKKISGRYSTNTSIENFTGDCYIVPRLIHNPEANEVKIISFDLCISE